MGTYQCVVRNRMGALLQRRAEIQVACEFVWLKFFELLSVPGTYCTTYFCFACLHNPWQNDGITMLNKAKNKSLIWHKAILVYGWTFWLCEIYLNQSNWSVLEWEWLNESDFLCWMTHLHWLRMLYLFSGYVPIKHIIMTTWRKQSNFPVINGVSKK